MSGPAHPSSRILVIRRDNIGDLLCTTPMLRALRQRFPKGWIGALVNSYNGPVLNGNPDVDEIFSYEKLKHLAPGQSRLTALADRVRMILSLRRRHIDYAILAASGFQASAVRLARLAGPRHIVGYGDRRMGIDIPVSADQNRPLHEVEACFRLLEPLSIIEEPPLMAILPDAAEVETLRRAPGWNAIAGTGPLVALHISARKPPQRWPVERFAELARRLHASRGARFLAFWAPGSANNPLHPGDDEKAAALAARLPGVPLLPVPTLRLPELIAGLSLCDRVVCSDGGAMHIAAALGKPIVCFFGNSDAVRWHPWGVPHVVLQKESCDVNDITVDEAFAAFEQIA